MMNKLLHIVTWCFAVVLYALAVGCGSSKKLDMASDKVMNVELIVTQTTSYCGGARPSEEILQELNSPSPSRNTKVFIGRGNENQGHNFIVETQTDGNGKVNVELPFGDYYLVFETKTIESKKRLSEEYRVETAYYSAMDADCLESWFKQPELTFTIGMDKTKTVVVNKHIPCSWSAIPCVDYRGPLPP